jgi:outer membrane protein assembly factor BamB
VSSARWRVVTTVAAVVVLAGGCNWPSYLFGYGHSSYNSLATAINPTDASSLRLLWQYTPPGNEGGVVYASPTVYGGQVYVGSQNGVFYDLDEKTGAVVWQHDIGQQPSLTCSEPDTGAQGFVSTAAVDTWTGTAVVYVAAPDGYLYAWNAATGALVWKSVVAIPSTTVNDYFNWSSPTVYDGKIYVGVASACDAPLVQGGEKVYDETTGNLLATFDTTPPDDIGGSIWSSALVSPDGSVYVTTGNPNFDGGAPGYSESIIRLNADSLDVEDYWTVPSSQQYFDADFGGSAVYWTADVDGTQTPMVGACNKNGYFYALRANDLSAGPLWTNQIGSYFDVASGTNCLSSAVWDQSANQLFLSGNDTTIGGVRYHGSVQEVDPATGAPVWQTGLPGAVVGTPTLDGSGVLAVGTLDYSGAPEAVYLLNASNGQILATINTNDSGVFAQPVLDDGYLFVDTAGSGILVYQPSSS